MERGLKECFVCDRKGLNWYKVSSVSPYIVYWLCDDCYERFLLEVTWNQYYSEWESVIRWMRYCIDGDRRKIMRWVSRKKG